MLTSFSTPELRRSTKEEALVFKLGSPDRGGEALKTGTPACLHRRKAMNEPETCFESGGEEPPPGSQPWTMEYVARLFLEGGGFQGIANTHNAALERSKAETEAASDLVLNSHGSRLTEHHICIAQNMGERPRLQPF
jgi:hypothetical protein